MSTWHVILVEGSGSDLRAFVAGFVAERRLDPGSVVVGDDVGLERESLGKRLHALFVGGRHAILVPEAVGTPLEDALARAGAAVALRIVDRQPVTAATFAFAAEVFSRDVATAIRSVVSPLPAGVRFAEHSEQEEEHREAKGVELYAPTHHYAFRTRGTVVGDPTGVLDIRRRLGAIEAVVLAPLRLDPPA